MKYGSLSLGQVEAIVNKIGGMKRVQSFLADELTIVPKGFFFPTHELSIYMAAFERLALPEMEKDHSWVGSIVEDSSPEEYVTMTLASVFPVGKEKVVSREEYGRCLAPYKTRLLGFQHCMMIFQRQSDQKTLQALRGKILHIDFPGTILMHRSGGMVVPCLYSTGTDFSGWSVGYTYLDDGFNASGRIAVASE